MDFSRALPPSAQLLPSCRLLQQQQQQQQQQLVIK